jgi:hypothetical protein
MVINRSPRGTELSRYEADMVDPQQKVYGLIALRPNLDGFGYVLILEGTSMAGTESAADFVFDDTRLLPFLEQIKSPNGALLRAAAAIEQHERKRLSIRSRGVSHLRELMAKADSF